MATRLTQNLTSGYFEAANRLEGKKKIRRRIIAYVESYDDIAFWRTLLEEAETDSYYFEVMLPSQTNLCKGKKQVLMNTLDVEALGHSLIACVDSDYDFLLQGATPVSHRINSSPYIFQTYAYAIENYQCNAESLHEVCVQATLNDRRVFDFVDFLTRYSRICYPLFLWCIHFYRHHDTNALPMHLFNNTTMLGDVNVRNTESILAYVQRHVDKKIAEMNRLYPKMRSQVEDLAPEMERLGLTPDTTYLYMQGHHVMDNVVMKLLQPICTLLRRERENEIHRLATHEEQCRNELTAYEHSQIAPELMLKKNRDYRHLYLYHWVQEDLKELKLEGTTS